MGHKLNIPVFFTVLLTLLLSSCYKDLDLTGFIRSTDRANERFTQSEQWNSQHPFREITIDSDEYSLLVAADSHIGGTVNFDKFVGEASKPDISAFVMVGDMVTGRKEDYNLFRQHLPPFDTVPYFLIAGNHELYFDGWKTFYDYFGSSTYLFTVKTNQATDLFICLDTGGGTLGNKQLIWLEDILQHSRAGYRNCTVFTHNNFFRSRKTITTNPLVEELYVLLDLFADHHVNLVINGHDHSRAEEVFGWTTYLILDALLDNDPNASYLKLTVDHGDIGYEFIGI
ncbi:MAG: metallophosphoesterase [Bacteroidales bacterium]|nr:metallophosphoesterase [Bacteroidales bacterium]